MTTTVNLIRQAESQGFVVFWADGAYHYAPTGREDTPVYWSHPFFNLNDCAHAAISASSPMFESIFPHDEQLMIGGVAVGFLGGASLVLAIQFANTVF
jgi:hypothetical protein